KAVLLRVGSRQARHCSRSGRKPLQITQRLVVQLAHRVMGLVDARRAAGTAEAIQIVRDAADWKAGTGTACLIGWIWVLHKDAGQLIPLSRCVRTGQQREVGVVSLGSDVLHWSAEYATIAIDVVVAQVAERRHPHSIAVLLQVADRLEVAVRIA